MKNAMNPEEQLKSTAVLNRELPNATVFLRKLPSVKTIEVVAEFDAMRPTVDRKDALKIRKLENTFRPEQRLGVFYIRGCDKKTEDQDITKTSCYTMDDAIEKAIKLAEIDGRGSKAVKSEHESHMRHSNSLR